MESLKEPMSYIGRKDCGCLVLAVVDVPEHRTETAHEVAAAIREGYAVERVTCDFVRETDWLCSQHRIEFEKKEVMNRMQGRLV